MYIKSNILRVRVSYLIKITSVRVLHINLINYIIVYMYIGTIVKSYKFMH